MRKTTETKFTKMLSLRVDKILYAQLERELRLQMSPETRISDAMSMTSLVVEMIEEQLCEREYKRTLVCSGYKMRNAE